MNPLEFFTVGYGRWPVARLMVGLLAALQSHRIELLIDIRHSPCASSLEPTNTYGPRDWHLHADGSGIVRQLQTVGIGYLWVIELGNPQKNDPRMAILREQLADSQSNWPVHRGLALVADLIRNERKRCCLQCACDDYAHCHRKRIAEALTQVLLADAIHCDLCR